jgi:2-polyprenyl-3-methyl-5-hydroxy-6-metoxy-1,4-benzoquinol methylase
MHTDYDRISIEYQLSKLQPWRKYLEAHTFFKLSGDLSDLNILDLACGDGFYTRQLKLRGAANVEGVDISKGMIQLARESEDQRPLGIAYHIQDVLHLKLNKKFDLITASYLLNYAKNGEELSQFGKVISEHLNPGGRFITINSNPNYQAPVNTLRKYGFTRENESHLEGGKITYRFYQEDGSHIEVVNYHLEISTHDMALKQAGLTNIQWHPLELSSEIESEIDADFWKPIIDTQPVIGLTCELKPAL